MRLEKKYFYLGFKFNIRDMVISIFSQSKKLLKFAIKKLEFLIKKYYFIPKPSQLEQHLC